MTSETTLRGTSRTADGDWGRLNARLIPVNLSILGTPLAMFLASLAVTGGEINLQVLIALGSLFVTCLIVSGIGLMRLFTTRYRLTEDRFEIHVGLLFRSRRSVPVGRIRSVDLTANPAHRLFGLTTLRIDSGEQSTGAGRRLALDGITLADARELRRRIIALRDAGKARPADDTDGVLNTLDWSWLRYGPLTIWGVGGVFVAAGTTYRILNDLKIDPLELGIVKDLVHRFGTVPLWYGILVTVLVIVALGVVGSTATFIENWAGYELRREDGGVLRIRRGLLVARSVTIEERRLRGLELVEPIPLRWAKGAKLNAVAAGLGNRDDNRKRRALTSPMPRAEALRVGAGVLPAGPGLIEREGLNPHPKAALRRRVNRAVVWSLLPAAVPAVLGLWFGPSLLVIGAVTFAVLLPILLAFAVNAYRTLGHGIRRPYLVASSGTFAHRTVALQTAGIIGWKISRTPFQRRSGLLTLGAATAAGEGVYHVYDLTDHQALTLAETVVPGLLAPFLERSLDHHSPGERSPDHG
ncbi:PH domain-containing protein [Streptomyces sp. NL15-2K]|uniref:PH domain-containing protein n=1 Tax=Streptomyces sp. NL15-2K TaxID=376149 RepID=UPI000F5730BE|nr:MULTISPECIES: PH domain-containing protein [Actinomycetes]WKX14222.1 PH domain-containing protein [Kutzneria buriramensis]GCB43892.1 transmembrane protein [Streptomyces sp. NL15-2K]